MAIQYQIKDGAVVLSLVETSGFTQLGSALDAIDDDPAWVPRMPLMFDLRGEPPKVRYEDVGLRLELLRQMRMRFGSRWAFLVDSLPARAGIRQMASALREHGGLDVALFGDWQNAILWLKEKPPPETFAFRVYIGTDEAGSFAWLCRGGEQLESGVSWRLVGATDDEDTALGLLKVAGEEGRAANRR